MQKTKSESAKPSKPKRKHIIDAFVFIEATTPDNPCTLKQLGLDLELYNSRIQYLIKNDLILPSKKKDTYYLDYESYKIFKEEEDKRFFIMLVSIIIPGVLLLLLGVIWLIL